MRTEARHRTWQWKSFVILKRQSTRLTQSDKSSINHRHINGRKKVSQVHTMSQSTLRRWSEADEAIYPGLVPRRLPRKIIFRDRCNALSAKSSRDAGSISLKSWMLVQGRHLQLLQELV
jgi:hypothetical protein